MEGQRSDCFYQRNTGNWLHFQRLDWKWGRLLQRERQSSLNHDECTNQRNGHFYFECNTNADTNSNPNVHSDPDANSYPNTDSNSDPDANSNRYSDTNAYAYSNAYSQRQR